MKRVLITGASGGIGLATAEKLAKKGYQLTLVARTEYKLAAGVKQLDGQGHSYIVADLTNKEDIDKVAAELTNNHYNILINNAGAGLYGHFIDLPLEQQVGTMFLNMDTLVILSYAFLQKAKQGDTLVNIASLLAHSSFPGGSVYAGTKSFVANFSESLWYEFKKKGVKVIGFNPGATKSDFHQNAGKDGKAFPESVLSSTAEVANELVNSLEKSNNPRVIQGWKNRMMLFGFKFLSRSNTINTMGKLSPGMHN